MIGQKEAFVLKVLAEFDWMLEENHEVNHLFFHTAEDRRFQREVGALVGIHDQRVLRDFCCNVIGRHGIYYALLVTALVPDMETHADFKRERYIPHCTTTNTYTPVTGSLYLEELRAIGRDDYCGLSVKTRDECMLQLLDVEQGAERYVEVTKRLTDALKGSELTKPACALNHALH